MTRRRPREHSRATWSSGSRSDALSRSELKKTGRPMSGGAAFLCCRGGCEVMSGHLSTQSRACVSRSVSGCIAVLAPNTSSRTQIHPMGARYCCWLLLGVLLRESFPAEESAGQGQKRLVYVCPFLIANSQAAELIQPSECPLHYPAPSPQSAAMLGVALRKKRHDMSAPQTLPDCLRVITTVA